MAEDVRVSDMARLERGRCVGCKGMTDIPRAVFPNDRELKPESIVAKWKEITSFGTCYSYNSFGIGTELPDERATHPSSGAESLEQILDNFNNTSASNKADADSGSADSDYFIDKDDTAEVKEAKRNPPQPDDYVYTERDVLLYNLGVGAKVEQLQWVYENADGFQVSNDLPYLFAPS